MSISKLKDICVIILSVVSALALAVMLMSVMTLMVFTMFYMLFIDPRPTMIEFSMTFKVCFFIFLLSVWSVGVFVEYHYFMKGNKRFQSKEEKECE